MRFEPRAFTLKNNETIVIRECVEEDAEALLHALRVYIGESEQILTTPEEFDMTVEKEKEWIRGFMRANSLLLIATHKGTIIGNIDLTGGHRKKISHTSLIGVGMLKKWRNQGLGAALFTSAIDWAKGNPALSLLWLQVFAGNAAGIALYQKMGFIEEGRQKNFFLIAGDQFDDNVIMSLAI